VVVHTSGNGTPSQVGPVPHTGFTGSIIRTVSHRFGWAKVPGGVLLGAGLLLGLSLLRPREAHRH
jgi:hypothetical protein